MRFFVTVLFIASKVSSGPYSLRESPEADSSGNDPDELLSYFPLETDLRNNLDEGAASCPQNSRFPVLVADRDNCRNYYVCIDGTAYKQECPTSYNFDCFFRICNHLTSRTNCETPQGSQEILHGNVSSYGECSAGPTRFLSDERSCEVFHQLDGNNKYTFKCPDGLHFDEDLQLCLKPESSSCTLLKSEKKIPNDLQFLLFVTQTVRRQLLADQFHAYNKLDALLNDPEGGDDTSEWTESRQLDGLLDVENILKKRMDSTISILDKLNNVFKSDQ